MDTVDAVRAKRRYEKTRDKYQRKIDRLLPKIHDLSVRRERLKAEGVGKG